MSKNTSPSFVIEKADSQTSSELLNFPLDIQKEGRAVKFSVREYNKGKVDASEKETIIANVYLPMPETLADSMNHSYDTFSGGGADRIASSLRNDSSAIGIGAAIAKEAAYSGGNAVLQTLSGKGGSLGDLGKVAQRELGGIAVNPRTSIFFNNTALKLYSFEYLMVARNFRESIVIDNIVKRFQYHSLPDTFDNGNGLIHPEFFVISFLSASEDGIYSHNEFLMRPNPCVLTQVAVTYNESAAPVFYHETGAPVAVRLSLQFQEIEIETKTSYEKKYNLVSRFRKK